MISFGCLNTSSRTSGILKHPSLNTQSSPSSFIILALINILSNKIGSLNVKFDAELESFITKKDSVELTFKNGTSEEFDYVFACDGINSTFRKQLFPQVKKRYSGQTIWRGIATCTLPVNYHTAYLEFWGENLRFATIPLNKTQYYWYACKISEENILIFLVGGCWFFLRWFFTGQGHRLRHKNIFNVRMRYRHSYDLLIRVLTYI